ncbi:hypothetical protein [Labilibacter marinus]|uniref:hypothetical protein n=1 Tax=Labilibacter marinus TaxID=1477105 RepID=UPI00094F589B|nr:hypothetical protein [Labilibacter marinus]
MKKVHLVLAIVLLVVVLISCNNEITKTTSLLSNVIMTTYHETEIFTSDELKVYGKWKLVDISGGFAGSGYENNFDYLELKAYGIYAFVKEGKILEYGKIIPGIQHKDDDRFLVTLEEDNKSDFFLADKEKYLVLEDDNQLVLQAPCCDRFNYHFERMK